jgi:hypothetical protein
MINPHFEENVDSIYTNFLSVDSFDMPKKLGIDTTLLAQLSTILCCKMEEKTD